MDLSLENFRSIKGLSGADSATQVCRDVEVRFARQALAQSHQGRRPESRDARGRDLTNIALNTARNVALSLLTGFRITNNIHGYEGTQSNFFDGDCIGDDRFFPLNDSGR